MPPPLPQVKPPALGQQNFPPPLPQVNQQKKLALYDDVSERASVVDQSNLDSSMIEMPQQKNIRQTDVNQDNNRGTNVSAAGSVKDLAKNMNFGFLGKSREQILLEKKQKEKEEIERRRQQEEFEMEERERIRMGGDNKSFIGQTKSFIGENPNDVSQISS